MLCVVDADIYRRSVDIHERQFLQDSRVVTEMQCDLGQLSTFTHSLTQFKFHTDSHLFVMHMPPRWGH